MRIVFFCFILTYLFADVNSSIQSNEQKLQNISREQSAISQKLKTLGNNINQKNLKIKQLDRQINAIQKNINVNQKLYNTQEKIYKDSSARLEDLSKRLERLQNEVVDLVLHNMTILAILNAQEPLSDDSIVREELLKSISATLKQKIDTLTKEEQNIKKEIQDAQERRDSAKKIIATEQEKQKALQLAKKEQQTLAKNLKSELDSYNNELKQLDKERVGIQKILVDLNILKKQELENQNQKRQDLKKESTKSPNLPPIEVRQIGSSYRNVSTAQYKGAKTIAPLKNYKIETRYGPYFDPVYKIRVFNEFVTFSVSQRSPVFSVLDGKIVFAKDTAMLKKVVIIEHKDGIHTIYSYLDEIPKNIKVGLNVKKSDTIAYVKDKLNFEVTQKDKHINPLNFIVAK